jgi:hypothetical protein
MTETTIDDVLAAITAGREALALLREVDTAARSVMGWRQWQARRDALLARVQGGQ